MNSEQNKVIAVLGATGRTGKWLVSELLKSGYDVRILVRHLGDSFYPEGRVQIFQGDATDYHSVLTVMKGSQAVLSTLGPTRLRRRAAKKLICSQATCNVIKAATNLNIKRYVVVSGAAVSLPQDKRNFYGWLSSALVPLFVWYVLKDKKIEARLLQESELDWTLVRCPEITNSRAKKNPVVSLYTPQWLQVRAGELACFLVSQIRDDSYLKRGVFVTSRL